ncbi:MAG: DUF3142 domain-containing protein [Bryobacteraceae bacterium]
MPAFYLLASLLLLSDATAPPPLMLWVWERPSDLRSLPARAGVAFLASTVTLAAGKAFVTPRFQPLQVKPGTFRMAVVRIEGPVVPVVLTHAQRDRTAAAIVQTARLVNADALQVDFDARLSERAFYSAVLKDVRQALGPRQFLSITALVSWCGAPQTWLNILPVNEVVPMAFEMGSGAAAAETLLRSGGHFPNPRCQAAIGVSTEGLALAKGAYTRRYIFPYGEWTETLLRSVLNTIQ